MKIKYKDIVKEFNKHSINVSSSIEENTIFYNINSVQNADTDDLSFFSNIKYLNKLKSTKAKACLISNDFKKFLPKNCKPIIISNPYYAFAVLSNLFIDYKKNSKNIISDNIFLNKESTIGKNVHIEPYCYIDKNTKIMDNVVIGSNSRIGPNVTINKNCIISNNVSISNSEIMENCLIKSGARIGQTGFGFEEKTKQKIQHHGNVIINKNSTVGSNTTIDRAVFDSTEIGEYSQIDNLVQIAHNVVLGKHSILAAQVGIAGSTIIGDFVKIGGQAGISGHLKIGNNVTIAAKSGVTKNIKDNQIVAGFPAKDIKLWKREIIKLGQNS